MATIKDIVSQVSESYRIYDSVFRSLAASTSTAQDVARRAIAQRTAIEKSMINNLSYSLNHILKLDNLSSSIRALTLANESIHKIIELKSLNEIAMRSAIEREQHWQNIMKSMAVHDQVTELALKRHTSLMLSASLAAQSKLMQLDSYRLGAAIQAHESLAQSLHSGLDKFTASYNRLFDFIGSKPLGFAEFAPELTQYPPIEIYREVGILEEITIPEDKQTPIEEHEIVLPLEQITLEDCLQQLDPNLGNLLRGAHSAINESNPDRVRHVTISLRELFTQVLCRLAPDDSVHDWNNADNLYHNGRPTRRARLLYINRSINVDPLTDFVNSDVDSALILIDALNSGSHEIKSRLTNRQLQALVDRTGSMLLFLFRLENINK